jgi:opacity protein-like surface antigen
VQTLGLHTFYDFRKGKRLRPFVGAGAGAAMLNFKFEGPADINPSFIVIGDDRDFSHYFNFFGGATYNVTQNLRLGAGIEYVTLKDDTIQSNIGGIEGINRAYNFFLSARWFFRDQ